MINLENHPYFTKYVNEETGAVSYFLTEKLSEIHQHLYFTNTSLTYDSKYLWIRCINTPAQFVTMAVVSLDPENPFIRQFPGIGAVSGCPCIIEGTHDIIFAEGATVYRADTCGNITEILSLPSEFLNNRRVDTLFTHASISCDGKYIVLDSRIADKVYVFSGNLQTGEVKLINNFGRMYDHAMFSPIDPELILIDQDWWRDYHTGEYFPLDNRMWLLDVHGRRFEPLLQSSWYGHDGSYISHDFWSKDGKICWVDYAAGAFECDLETRTPVHVWKRPMCHCHTTADRKYWCADQNPYDWPEKPCKVYFFDREENKEIEIFSALPRPKVPRSNVYHLDPHPAFTDDGEYIISTATLFGDNTSVAITPTAPLKILCREKGIKCD